MTIAAVAGRVRTRVRVEGTVQGVGFRPYVYRLAGVIGLDGFVLNDAHGVLVEVEGAVDLVEQFTARLAIEAPPLAKSNALPSQPCQPTGTRGFAIRESPRDGVPDAPVTPDSATCATACRGLRPRRPPLPVSVHQLHELRPALHHRAWLPYDRPFTTMAGFRMCERCQAEFDDPGDRRFHAQPNACPECGPSVSLVEASGGPGGARWRSRRRRGGRGRLLAGRFSRSRASAGSTSPAGPTTRMPSGCCARASIARTSLRADGPRSRDRAALVSLTPRRNGSCLVPSPRSSLPRGGRAPVACRSRRAHPSSGSCSLIPRCTICCSPTPGPRWS